ncbi:MAG: hypothetical protein RMZ42_13775 [Nostoc sp. DedQUE05]|nr:hypothetical protein [Nostoc sp. DedQUE05]MDZ8092980.1 hypothetical protein [Nostoc sp. DedQUE05]
MGIGNFAIAISFPEPDEFRQNRFWRSLPQYKKILLELGRMKSTQAF